MILNSLLIIAANQALFFAVILFVKKNRHLSDCYLAAWMLVLSAYMVDLICLPTYKPIFSMLHSVFLFLYIQSITGKLPIRKSAACFIPFILSLSLCWFAPSFLTTPTFRIAQLLIPLLFIGGSLLQLRRCRCSVKKGDVVTEYVDMTWLYLLFYGNLFFFLVSVGSSLFQSIPDKAINAVALFLFMNLMGIKAIMQQVLFIKKPMAHDEKPVGKSYANYGLKGADIDSLAKRLEQQMETEKLYANQDLTLNDLSNALGVYPHYVTQLLSTVFNQNFYDYINTYRVEEAKKQLKDPKKTNQTILAIAYDCGFSSKTAFNRAFKQKTSQTPSEYRRIDNE